MLFFSKTIYNGVDQSSYFGVMKILFHIDATRFAPGAMLLRIVEGGDKR